jgi:Spy/CpxP family protein refolding chaperone
MKRSTKMALTVGGGLFALVLAVGLGGRALADGQVGGQWKHKMMKQFVQARLEKAFEVVRADPQQRQVIQAAKDRVVAAFEKEHGNRRGMMEDALALFESNTIDQVKLDALIAEHEARRKVMHQTVLNALREVHTTLSPDQRRALTAHIRAQAAKWHGAGQPAQPAQP